MQVKYANQWYPVIGTLYQAGLTWYEIEDEPGHTDLILDIEGIKYD